MTKIYISNKISWALEFLENNPHKLTWKSVFRFLGLHMMSSKSAMNQKYPSRGVLIKRCSKNMQQIYRRTPMRNCDFIEVFIELYLNLTFARVFFCKFTAYFQNNLVIRTPMKGSSWPNGDGGVVLSIRSAFFLTRSFSLFLTAPKLYFICVFFRKLFVITLAPVYSYFNKLKSYQLPFCQKCCLTKK